MGKKRERLSKARQHVATLRVNAAKLEIFQSVLDELSLSDDEADAVGKTIHVKEGFGDEARRVALRGLELATIVKTLIARRSSLGVLELKGIAGAVKATNTNLSTAQLNTATEAMINGYPDPRNVMTMRVYVEDATAAGVNNLSVDLRLPGQDVAKTTKHENTYDEDLRLPNIVVQGGKVGKEAKGGPWAFMKYDGGTCAQGRVNFTTTPVVGVWTNDLSYCVAVFCLYGTLPQYSHMTSAHLPGGGISNLDMGALIPADLGAPSKIVVIYTQDLLDSRTLKILDLLGGHVAANRIFVYGAWGGGDFLCDKMGYFGKLSGRRPTVHDAYWW